MSEWVKDKIYAFKHLDYYPIIITSTINPKMIEDNVKYIRLPSLAPTIFLNELKANIKDNLIIHFVYLPVVITLGLVFELTERLILKRLGHGIFSWTLSVIIYYIFNFWRYDAKILFSTGGPVSAHASATILGLISGLCSIIELQDPLVGSDIGHNKISSRYLLKLEKIIVKYADKIIFVTKKAAAECKLRYPNNLKIYSTYTSSVDYKIEPYKSFINLELLKIIHLGTIYATRNYKNLISALQEIKIIQPDLSIHVLNLGIVSIDNLDTFQNNDFEFIIKTRLPRIEGLKLASEFDLLLLIQHTDKRSQLTIPYKTWDYLNLKIPILALTNNPELDRILQNHGHIVAKNDDIRSIELALKNILENYSQIRKNIKKNTFNIVDQTKKMIQL